LPKCGDNPIGITFDEAEYVLTHSGYRYRKTNNGSHNNYISKNGDVFTIPKHNPLKAIYVKLILSKIIK